MYADSVALFVLHATLLCKFVEKISSQIHISDVYSALPPHRHYERAIVHPSNRKRIIRIFFFRFFRTNKITAMLQNCWPIPNIFRCFTIATTSLSSLTSKPAQHSYRCKCKILQKALQCTSINFNADRVKREKKKEFNRQQRNICSRWKSEVKVLISPSN